MIPDGYISIQCEDCGSDQDMEFSTRYGDESLSRLFCGHCSDGWRAHMIRNGDITEEDAGDYFTYAYCHDCGNEDDLIVSEGGNATDVTCVDCVKEKLIK